MKMDDCACFSGFDWIWDLKNCDLGSVLLYERQDATCKLVRHHTTLVGSSATTITPDPYISSLVADVYPSRLSRKAPETQHTVATNSSEESHLSLYKNAFVAPSKQKFLIST
jgi:hypothetical protein